MALCIPPDLILTVLEGVTAIIHYCLLDPTSQYHQVRAPCPNKLFKTNISLQVFTTKICLFTTLHDSMKALTILLHILSLSYK